MRSKIIAHRGLRSLYPENTVPAIQHALQAGIDGVEFDLELTADRQLVALHQETLRPEDGRLKLADRDARRSWVGKMKQADVCQIDAGSWFDPKYKGLKIPAFSELRTLAWGGKTAMVELKDPFFWTEPDSEYENLLVQVAEKELKKVADSRLIVLCFNEIVLQKLRIINPQIRLGLNVWLDRVDQVPELIEFAERLDICLIQFPDQVLCQTPEIVRDIRAAGIAVGSYSVSPAYNDPNHQHWTFAAYQPTFEKLLSLAVDYIITDFATESLEYLNHDIRNN